MSRRTDTGALKNQRRRHGATRDNDLLAGAESARSMVLKQSVFAIWTWLSLTYFTHGLGRPNRRISVEKKTLDKQVGLTQSEQQQLCHSQ